MKAVMIILSIFVVLLLITVIVSLGFIRFVLAAVPDRNQEKPDSPTDKEPELADPVQLKFYHNRKALRADGAEFEKTTKEAEIINKDGLSLKARYRVQDKETSQWIISIHGYKESHTFMLPYGAVFYKKGYNVLMPDNRAHGRSEGSYIGMGWLDKEDIEEWVNWIVNRDPKAQIILHGISMGGATVMMTAGKNLSHVAGYIEDCGYTSVWDIFACVLKRDYHLPVFPILHCCRLICRKKTGYDYVEASSIMQLGKCEKPILFIHGEKDGFVPLDMCYQVYGAFTGSKDLYIAPNAGHADSMDYDPDTYFEKVFQFIETKVNGSEANVGLAG